MYSFDNISTIYLYQRSGDDSASGLSYVCDGTKPGPVRTFDRALSLIRELEFLF